MNNRWLLFAVGGVVFFAVIVLVWYFFYVKPVIAPSLARTNNPLAEINLPVRFQFLSWGDDETSTSTTEVSNPLRDPLVRIWNKPATGQTFTTQEVLKDIMATTTQGTSTIEVRRTIRASSTVVLFVDKTTGYIYGYPLETGNVFQVSNTIIPGVHDAYFFQNGTRVIIRYIDRDRNTVMALLANVPQIKEGAEAVPLVNTTNLSSLVTSIAVNGRDDRASYVVSTETGSSIYTTTSNGISLLESSPFKEWSLAYGGETLFVTSKPSAYVSGVTAIVPSFSLRTGEKTGLLSLPNNSGELLNSMWSSSGLVTFMTTNAGENVLPIKTLANKCAWGAEDFLVCAVPRRVSAATEGLPDDWLQGRVSFEDDLYIVDKNGGGAFPFYTFSEGDGSFDVTNIKLLNTKDILTFTRKQDSTLWLVNTNLLTGE